MKRLLFCLLLITAGEWWSVLSSGVDSNLRGVSIVRNSQRAENPTIWASGSHGAVLKSTDSGKNWERLRIQEGEKLDFRGVQALDANVAYVMSSGEGEKSRIYKTADGGKTWTLQYTDRRKEFFLDGLACVSTTNCFALSDPVGGKFILLHTADGTHWTELPRDKMPVALEKEGAFAASNSSLLLLGEQDIYFGTGGPAARVFHSADLGKSWTVEETPILSGKASQGIFSLARSGDTLVAVGGDYEKPEQTEGTAAYSLDQGKTWTRATKAPGGYRSSVAKGAHGFVAVGPNGADSSEDGIDWEPAGKTSLNAVEFSGDEGWGAGAKGLVARFLEQKH
jgi:photosystem II stability/assembly factor-like uncharacterized protein